jgi:hypothetical protein
LHLELENLWALLGPSGLGNFNAVAIMMHSREFNAMQRKPILRCYGSKRKDHARNHSPTQFNYHLDAFALTAMLSTILKTQYHAKSYIAIPSCVPGSVSNFTFN